jgi:hypothetical protein
MRSNRVLEMNTEEIKRVEILRMAEEKRITQKQGGGDWVPSNFSISCSNL